jgi:hypothetical protein
MWFVDPNNPNQAIDLNEVIAIKFSADITFLLKCGSSIAWFGNAKDLKCTYEQIIRLLQEPRVRKRFQES